MTCTKELSKAAQALLDRGDGISAGLAWEEIQAGRTAKDILLFRHGAAAVANPQTRFSEKGLRERYSKTDEWCEDFLQSFGELVQEGYLIPDADNGEGVYKLEDSVFNTLATGIRTFLESNGTRVENTRTEWDDPIQIPAITAYARNLGVNLSYNLVPSAK